MDEKWDTPNKKGYLKIDVVVNMKPIEIPDLEVTNEIES